MDILQQSLQAADILVEEDGDLFGELGLSFNNTSTENVEIANDLATLASQGDSLCTSASGANLQESFGDFVNDSSGFDTSQFLNTAAPVHADAAPPLSGQQNRGCMPQGNLPHAAANSLKAEQSAKSFQLTPKRDDALVLQTNRYQSAPLSQAPPARTMQNSVTVALQSASLFPNNTSKAITTVAQAVTVATCNSVFSKLPTQPLITTSVQAAAGRTVNPRSVQLSTPIQIVQPSSGVTQQGSRQLITLVQKPNSIVRANSPAAQTPTQVINGFQPPQSGNAAVLKIAGKHSLNLSDHQVFKALAASIQKQKMETNTNQPARTQFIKLGQNVINVVSQRPQQQSVVRGTQQQITLQNGQTILLNSGQQVQLCTSQSQSGQIQVLQPTASTPVQKMVVTAANNKLMNKAENQTAKSSHLPIKGIQIASVNIPIVSSSASTTSANIATALSNAAVLAIPLLPAQETSQNSTSQKTEASIPVTQNSARIRNILANAILKQTNSSTNNSNAASQGIVQVQTNQSGSSNATANGQVGITNQPQVGTMLRLNITPQQASQLTPAQLQVILKQHQASLQAKATTNVIGQAVTTQAATSTDQSTLVKTNVQQRPQTAVSPSLRPFTPSSASATTNTVKPVAADQAMVQVFKVDPTLTEAQVDEVKKLLANRTIASKLSYLTTEQQQLVLAFQAQIRTMSPPVQQYYLRNPQLFMQKVLQQIRLGKPFILQVKMDSLSQRIVTTVSTPKPQHPTISLNPQDPNRAGNNRFNRSSPVLVTTGLPQTKIRQPATMIASTTATATRQTFTVQMPKPAVKRPAPEPAARVSLVLEQLECHKRMASTPDCTHPFKSVRDAIRRLVPFHTCNIPDVKQVHFEESEKMFNQISDQVVRKTRAMVNKYHLLCLRDSSRDFCSAETVMVERMFLQKEKAKLAEDKARLKENPSLIKEYFPQRFSEIAITSNDDEKGKTCAAGSNSTATGYEKGSPSTTFQETDASGDPSLSNDGPMSSQGADSGTDFRTNPSGKNASHGYANGPPDAKRPKADVCGADYVLLQEAVDSIL